MRTSKSKITYLIANINKLELLNSLVCRKGQKADANDISKLEQVKLILDSHSTFKNFGSETLKITEHYNGDNSHLNIYIFSRSPCGTDWLSRDINLACTSDFIYSLSNQ